MKFLKIKTKKKKKEIQIFNRFSNPVISFTRTTYCIHHSRGPAVLMVKRKQVPLANEVIWIKSPRLFHLCVYVYVCVCLIFYYEV